jgi:hypothetical protein
LEWQLSKSDQFNAKTGAYSKNQIYFPKMTAKNFQTEQKDSFEQISKTSFQT